MTKLQAVDTEVLSRELGLPESPVFAGTIEEAISKADSIGEKPHLSAKAMFEPNREAAAALIADMTTQLSSRISDLVASLHAAERQMIADAARLQAALDYHANLGVEIQTKIEDIADAMERKAQEREQIMSAFAGSVLS